MKNYYDEAISYKSLRKSLNRCCRGIRWKDSVVGYELHAPQNTYRLSQSLKNGTYKISPYQKFIIHEPKTREIVATRIVDRQVQMSLCQCGLYDDIVEHFIYDNCACQKGKGTDFTLRRIKAHRRFVITETGKIRMYMNSKKLGTERRRIKKLITKEINGEVAEGTTYNSMTAWRANAKRGDAYYREVRMKNYYYEQKAGAINGYRKRERTPH